MELSDFNEPVTHQPAGVSSRRIAIGAAGTAVLLAALDAYVVVGVLIDMVRDLGIPVNQLERATPIVTGFLLGYVAGMPLLGQLSDRYGRRPVLLLACSASRWDRRSPRWPAGCRCWSPDGCCKGWPAARCCRSRWRWWPTSGPRTGGRPPWVWSAPRRSWAACSGTLYGVGLATAFNAWRFTEDLESESWRWVFWVNLPLTALAMLIVAHTVPGGRRRDGARPGIAASRPGIDVVGGGLLALALGLLVVGLYNPDPARGVLPTWGLPVIGAALAVLAVFVWWERRAKVRLLDPAGVQMGRFLAVLGVSMAAGAALMVTLVDVELFAQTLLGLDSGRRR